MMLTPELLSPASCAGAPDARRLRGWHQRRSWCVASPRRARRSVPKTVTTTWRDQARARRIATRSQGEKTSPRPLSSAVSYLACSEALKHVSGSTHQARESNPIAIQLLNALFMGKLVKMALESISITKPGIVQLICCSRIIDPLDANRLKQDINDILQHGQVKNSRLEITGALLTDRTSFAQVLEGPINSIESVYSKLVDDERHYGHELLLYVGTHVRLFPWSALAFVEVDHIPGVAQLNSRSTLLDRRKACLSIMAALRPLLLG